MSGQVSRTRSSGCLWFSGTSKGNLGGAAVALGLAMAMVMLPATAALAQPRTHRSGSQVLIGVPLPASVQSLVRGWSGPAPVAPVGVPKEGVPPPYAVPLSIVEEVAQRRAWAVWGSQARIGSIIPMCDLEGQTTAYLVDFTLDGSPMPNYVKLAADAERERESRRGRSGEGPKAMPPTFGAPATLSLAHRYAHLVVSARSDRMPVLEMARGPSAYYSWAAMASRKAAASRLNRIFYQWPDGVWFEFAQHTGVVVGAAPHSRAMPAGQFHARTIKHARQRPTALGTVERDEGADKVLRNACEDAWLAARSKAPKYFEKHYIYGTSVNGGEASHDDWVAGRAHMPFFDWHRGCAPTAVAMCLGYYDEFRWFGRLIDYYYHPAQGAANAPNVTDELAYAMHTGEDGGTNSLDIEPGTEQVANVINPYSFDVTMHLASLFNDWGWDVITAAVDDNDPYVWSTNRQWTTTVRGQHSVAGYGYGIIQGAGSGNQYVLVHNTWDWTEKAYVHVDGDPLTCPQVHRIDAGGGVFYNARLTHPRGQPHPPFLYGGQQTTITWDNHGRPADEVKVLYSPSAGEDAILWYHLATVPDEGAFEWLVPNEFTSEASISIQQVSAGTVVSSDGSWNRVRIQKDQQAPVTPTVSSASHPSSAQWYSNNDPTFDWVTHDCPTTPGRDEYTSGIRGYWYGLDEPDPGNHHTTGESKQLHDVADGVHTFYVKAEDNVGNESGVGNRKVRIDTSTPSVPSISSPTHPNQNQSYANDDPEFEWQASNDQGSGVDHYEVHLDGGSWHDVGDNRSKNYSNLPDGEHVFSARAVDGAGNIGAAGNYGFKIDSGPSAPTAGFDGTPTTGSRPLSVQFTDRSTGEIDTWSWNFGDGHTSTSRSPRHEYQDANTYTVSLTVRGPGGEDTRRRTDYIHVLAAVETLTVAPSGEITLYPDGQQQFTATAHYDNGDTADVSSLAAWEWDGPTGTGDVSDNGLFTGGSVSGSGRVRATFDGKTDTSGLVRVLGSPVVTSPNDPGVVWTQGRSDTITWQDFDGPDVRIQLCRNGTPVRTISSATPNDGRFVWRVPVRQRAGAGHSIRISSVPEDGSQDSSDNAFRIQRCSRVTYPDAAGIRWTVGQGYAIQWKGFVGERVRIKLYKGGVFSRNIGWATPNDGRFFWQVPANQAYGNNYSIRISSATFECDPDFSNNHFSISGPNRKVTYPSAAGLAFARGRSFAIRWRGFTGGQVRIQLYTGGRLARIISRGTPNDGQFWWRVPDDLPPGGQYRIRISARDYSCPPDFSNNYFRVTAAKTAVGSALVISSAQVSQGAVGATISYSLSAAADVEVTVLNIAGRPVRRLSAGSPSPAGMGSVIWNLMSAAGTRVPQGLYLCTIRARGADGQSQSVVLPMTVSR